MPERHLYIEVFDYSLCRLNLNSVSNLTSNLSQTVIIVALYIIYFYLLIFQ